MSSDNNSLVLQEVEALQAIYGDENVSFQSHDPLHATAKISVSLESLLTQPHTLGRKISLSTSLPSGYPTTAKPNPPTLRSDAFSSATAARLVAQMLDDVFAPEGEVCLFQYCQDIVSILETFSHDSELSRDAGAAVSGPTDNSKQSSEDQYEIMHGEPLTDRKSVFQAHVAEVRSSSDVDAVLEQLKASNRKIATATHNPFAYRIATERSIQQDADDDGENGAGKNILFILQQTNAIDVICVVSRWYGGSKLGPVRFKHICKVARDLLELRQVELSQAKSTR
ncbi:unnamed protein product [Chondrus crispus]|uniref:RWD domain-containing protein n=1 Tax=Chondrus crispus TaxID=2769 RepID=R7QU75_CHOCR|nr:unnamed protein product [Chondrus crispus]CDF41016.1 unnamed protein product [Chondrus crispus]|eukprot:XP_005711310.1 unnamed protein product [Chondrus crispus]